MRCYFVLVVCVLASAFALPVEELKGEDPSLATSDEDVDPDYDDADHYHIGFFSRLNSFIDAFRHGMWNVRTELMSGIDVDNLPAEYSNSTFHEEVVNGTRVQVNQTIYRNEVGGANIYIFRKVVRVVDDESGETTVLPEEDTTIIRSDQPLKEIEAEVTSRTTEDVTSTTDISNDLPANGREI